MDKKAIGKRLAKLRAKRSQAEVCKAVGITQQALSAYETGLRMPRDGIKIKLANYYNRTVQYIFFS